MGDRDRQPSKAEEQKGEVMNQRQKLAGEKWSSLWRQVNSGKLSPREARIVFNEYFQHLCKLPGLAANIDPGDDSQSPINPSAKQMNKNTHKPKPVSARMLPEQQEALEQVSDYSGVSIPKLARLAISEGIPHVQETFGPAVQHKQPTQQRKPRLIEISGVHHQKLLETGEGKGLPPKAALRIILGWTIEKIEAGEIAIEPTKAPANG